MKEADLLNAKILIIDDAEANLKLLEDLLAKEGFHQIVSTADPTHALDLFKAFEPDLILLDLMMPELDGYALLEIFSRHIARDEYLPILVLTADATIGAKRKALALGAKDFLTKPFDTIEAMMRVWNLLETRMLYRHLKMLNASIKPLQHGQSQENSSS
jgi:PleD family two-component response regulator